jgi:hypothetical protein
MYEKLSSNQHPKKPVPPVMNVSLFRISSPSGLVWLRIWSRSEVGKGCCAIGSVLAILADGRIVWPDEVAYGF